MTKQDIYNSVNDFLDELVIEAEYDDKHPPTKEETDAVILLREFMKGEQHESQG